MVDSVQPSPHNDQYNYPHFESVTLKRDARLVTHPKGALPGEPAPDFTLEDTVGKTWRLEDLRGRPVVLVFGSGTCPMTIGSTPGLLKLAQGFGGDLQWLMVYIPEAHPGEGMPAHDDFEQKRRQAERLRVAEGIDWPVLVDGLDGQTHKAYSEMPNPVFVIDRDGQIAFRGEFAHAPTLWRALSVLQAQDWRGDIPRDFDRKPHMLGATVFGWRGPSRSGETAEEDLSRGAKPMALNLRLGKLMEPALGPLARRSRPVPTGAKLAMLAGAVGLAILAGKRTRR